MVFKVYIVEAGVVADNMVTYQAWFPGNCGVNEEAKGSVKASFLQLFPKVLGILLDIFMEGMGENDQKFQTTI